MTPTPTPTASALPNPLSGLRPYHVPDAVSWWPPAPGWWLLAALLLLLGSALGWWLVRRHRRRAASRQATTELTRLRSDLSTKRDGTGFVRELSKLLRRYALAIFPGDKIAALTGEDWLMFLDAHGGDGRFRKGPGRQLAEAPYRPSAEVPNEELAELVADWINRNREVRP